MQIMWEGGPASLTDDEIAKACRDRGIREGESSVRMRHQLTEWLDLSQKKEIPGSLLILSRAFLYTGSYPTESAGAEGLVETLGSLPDDIIMDVKQAADVSEGSNAERLEETLRQAKLIEIESDREARKEKDDEEKRKKKEDEEEAERLETESLANGSPEGVADESISDKTVAEKVKRHEERVAEAIFGAKEQVVPGRSEVTKIGEAEIESVAAPEAEEKDEEQEAREQDVIRKLLLSLGELSSDSAVEQEREELRNLKLELAEAEQFVKETEGTEGSDLKRFRRMVTKLEREVERVDAKVGLRMKLLDKDNDGLMSLEECTNAMAVIAGDRDDEVVAETLKRLDGDEDGNISRGDLTRVLNEMQFEYGVVNEDKDKTARASEGALEGESGAKLKASE
ncbi:unnamed protein product [Chondrus crispus]|uniref:Mitochondrial proton/calcium exchanger protein n=1 Tax=Chondrus crispus TaxID=2769 RepID=R7QFB3_CHOCR|nr:unnamed protein product [Chondrus crispus]CDF36448.1 unnamed protein product [Chondrus crispus]|eukprot:XP_005716267.1 unnamed protein product [Chondrus crispus]